MDIFQLQFTGIFNDVFKISFSFLKKLLVSWKIITFSSLARNEISMAHQDVLKYSLSVDMIIPSTFKYQVSSGLIRQ